jgi:uncharacterized membrane protein
MNKKGFVNKVGMIIPVAIILVVLGLLLTFSADIQQEVSTDQLTGAAGCNSTDVSACGYSYNTSVLALEATEDIGNRQDTLVSISIAVVLIGLIMGFFALGRR